MVDFDFDMVVACDQSFGIGRAGELPWYFSNDFKLFKKLTQGDGRNVMIMGSTTWTSCLKERVLPNRLHIVLSRSLKKGVEGVVFLDSLSSLNDYWKQNVQNYDNWFVIGGANIYSQFIQMRTCRYLYVSHINGDYQCDRFFPSISSFRECRQEEMNQFQQEFFSSDFEWKCYQHSSRF